jgi:WhiB family redox-sensing transcriptional regulator
VVFFPPTSPERRDEKRYRERNAKAICADCGVRDQCLQHALHVNEQHGIWGGTNESERREMTAPSLS